MLREQKNKIQILSVEEYRAILNDHKSTDEQIEKRLAFLEQFCRGIIRQELTTYVQIRR
jgi:hypothetical protein